MASEPEVIKQTIQSSRVYNKRVPGRGNGLFASDDLPVKSQILSVATPLMLALETSKLHDTCYQCFRSVEAAKGSGVDVGEAAIQLKSCTGCMVVKFCSKECQTLAWSRYHKWECKTYAKLCPRILPAAVRAVIRLLKQRKAGILPKGEFEQLLSLEDHQDEMSSAGGQRWQNMFLMAKAAKTYSGIDESMEVVFRVCCILTLNSFTLTTPTFDPLGMVLHPHPALMNHSCDPNAIVRFDVNASTSSPTQSSTPRYGSMSVIALRAIPEDEEITISYIDATFPFSNRQTELKDRYFFTCTCALCLQGRNAATDQFNTAQGIKATDPILLEAQRYAENIFRDLQSKPGMEASQISNLTDALRALARTNSWPLRRYPRPQLRQQLILALLGTKRFGEALTQSAILVRLVDPEMFEQAHHPVRWMHAWTFWNLCRHSMEETMMNGGGHRDVRMLGLLSCLVIDDIVKVMGRADGWEGELERMVNSAHENVQAEGPVWREYEGADERTRETMWAEMDVRIRQALEDEGQ